jgi:hypothetical protein
MKRQKSVNIHKVMTFAKAIKFSTTLIKERDSALDTASMTLNGLSSGL